MPAKVSWRYDATSEPWLRWCLLAGTAAVFSLVFASAFLLVAREE